MKNKKSQGLSLQTIIIAVIVIVVLVVIIFIFTGQLGKFRTDIGGCHTRGGECSENTECPDNHVKLSINCGKIGNTDDYKACCVPVIEE